MNAKGSRVVIIDEVDNIYKTKSDSDIIKENEEFRALLENGRKNVSDPNDKIKEAIREDNYQELMQKKRAEKAAKATEEAVVQVPPQQEEKTVIADKSVSLKFGVVGAGQAGSKVAKVFYDLGYNVCAINTAKQDLELLDIPNDNKFLLTYSIGGAGRDLEVGRAALEQDYNAVKDFVEEKIGDADVSILCVSGGGGSGSGSATTMTQMLCSLNKPLIVIYILPGSTDDSQSKHNAIKTLAELSEMSAKNQINSLVLVDNAKIELAYPNLSQATFWKTANAAIVDPLHMFNSVTARPTDYEALDSMDFSLALLESGGCVLFGSNKVSVDQYSDNEFALVEAIVDNLEKGLLAGGFNLKEAQTVGVLVTARESVLEKVPHSQISFIFKYIAEEFASAKTFKGVYALPSDDDDITIHFVFSGLGLPRERVESLKNEAKKHMDILSAKKKDVASKMSIDLGKDKITSAADSMMDKIRKKNGVVGQLIRGAKKDSSDRRR